jgi:Ca2+-binding RTX toxin-like protein
MSNSRSFANLLNEDLLSSSLSEELTDIEMFKLSLKPASTTPSVPNTEKVLAPVTNTNNLAVKNSSTSEPAGLLRSAAAGAIAPSSTASSPPRSDAFGVPSATSSVTTTGDNNVDALLGSARWTNLAITYSFTDSFSNDYEAGYANAAVHSTSFLALNAQQQSVARAWLGVGGIYDNISGLAPVELTGASDRDATIRMAMSSDPGTAYAYYPNGSFVEGGDAWFNKTSYNTPVIGNYAFHTFGHELGHALGLEHGHEANPLAMNADRDSMEFSIMTYRPYIGASTTSGYGNETWGFAQTLMMYDIRAIQQMYGAEFGYNSSNTSYTFSLTTGEMFANGVSQGTPGANRIFRTLWDGDGIDTYDFSNYTTNLAIDLTPGGWSDLSVGDTFQKAKLDAAFGTNTYARGHVFNALQYNGDVRSLIENTNGGVGSDSVKGNTANNLLNGNGGADTLDGGLGNDTIEGGLGSDIAVFAGLQGDYAIELANANWVVSDLFSATNGDDGVDLLSNIEFLRFLSPTTTDIAVAQLIGALADADLATNGVDESTASGTTVGITALAIDGNSQAVTYSLTDDAGGRFGINSTTGLVTVANGSAIDFEVTTAHNITVKATSADGSFTKQTFTINVNNVSESFSVTNLNAAESYTEDTALNLTDIVVTGTAAVTATLTLSDVGAGSLSIGTAGAVTSTYDGATGVWSATGAVADVNALLASVTLNPTANFNGNFSVATSVSDGVSPVVTGTKAFTGIAVNDAPTATNLSTAESYTEDVPLDLIDIVVADIDSGNVTVTLTLSNTAAGSLNTATSGVVTSSYNATTGVWSASGAVANVNTLLAGVTFNPAANFNGNFTIATSVSDGASPAITGSKAFTGISVIDAPTATNLSAAESYAEDTVKNLTDIVITATDSPTVTATLTLSNLAAGSLSTATSGAVTATYNSSTGVWSATGAVANVNALLAGVTFNPAANFNGNFAIATSVTDGINPAITGTKTLTGIGVNDAPTTTGLSAQSIGEGQALNLNAATAFSDVDGNALTYALTRVGGILPTWLQINTTTGVITSVGNIPSTGAGTYNLQVTASDGSLSANSTFTLNVLNLIGTTGIDTLMGSAGNEQLEGLAGADRLSGLGGNDTLLGGDGNDTLEGGAGADVLNGGLNTDIASYFNSTATITANLGNAALNGGDALGDTYIAIENLEGSNTANSLLTGDGLANIITSYGGADSLDGSGGNDTLAAGNGADSLQGGAGNDSLTGGAGTDRFYFGSGAALSSAIGTQLGIDRVTDFVVGTDKLYLSSTTFNLTAGALASNQFISVAKDSNVTSAASSGAKFIYSRGSGNLYLDTNGSTSGFGTNGGQFAILTSRPLLVASDFVAFVP